MSGTAGTTGVDVAAVPFAPGRFAAVDVADRLRDARPVGVGMAVPHCAQAIMSLLPER